MKLLLPSLVLCAGGTVVALTETPDVILDGTGFDAVAIPSRIVQLGAATDGLLAEVAVDRGDIVQAGQIVAHLDVTVEEADASLARARSRSRASREMVKARLSDAKRRLAHREMLLGDGYVTPDEVDSTRTEVQLEELALAKEDEAVTIADLERQRAETILAQGTIQSPVDGVVIERHLSPGELLSRSGQAEVLTIAELDPLVIEVHVPVEYYRKISVGDTGTVTLDVPGNPEHQAPVTVKDRQVDTASRTFRVRMELPNPDFLLPSGLRCRVVFAN
jgi:RND family efflux transporter MFP subunit